jgi:hypothetical protein
MSKRKTLAIVSAVAAFAAVSASAAGLGGLTGTSLGADTTIVASCDTDGIGVNYTTTYNVAAKEYVVSAVNLTGVNAACNAKVANLTLTDTTVGAAVISTTAVASLTVSGTFTASIPVSPTVSAKNIGGLSLVISG